MIYIFEIHGRLKNTGLGTIIEEVNAELVRFGYDERLSISQKIGETRVTAKKKLPKEVLEKMKQTLKELSEEYFSDVSIKLQE